MSFVLNSKDYMGYVKRAADHIGRSGDYISSLDAATGDGDHWLNINKGFHALVEKSSHLESLGMSACLKEIGMMFMSVVGGSSGVLYGGAYLAASKYLAGGAEMNSEQLCGVLNTMAEDMIKRGKSEPGFKTMIDSIYPAAKAYSAGLESGLSDEEILKSVKQAATDGAEATKEMPAIRGRASYQSNKGVGHLDPGAVTMSYQIEDLCDYILENKVKH